MRETNINVPVEKDEKSNRASLSHIPRKTNKIGNTTSTSLQRYVSANKQADQNSTVKTAFYEAN